MMGYYLKFMKSHGFGCGFSVYILSEFGRSDFISGILLENIRNFKG